MNTEPVAAGQPEARAEKPGLFQFYNPHLAAWRWAVLAAVEAVALGVLLFSGVRVAGAAVFTFAPLIALLLLAPDMLRKNLRLPTWRHVLLGLGLGVSALLVTSGVAILVMSLVETTANPINDVLASQSLAQNLLTLLVALVQLFGEELLTLIAFMGVYQLCSRFWGGKAPGVVAWVVSSVIFALVHLQTYGFNVLQVLLVIGVARMVLTLGYMITKNLAVSYISHIVDDNTIFLFTMLTAALR